MSPKPTYTVTTYSPTNSYTTYLPTWGSPSAEEGRSLFFWGAHEAIGTPLERGPVMSPLVIDVDAVHTAAGSRFSLIVMSDGAALSAGFVESLDNYQGHLGLKTEDIVEGVNVFLPISLVHGAVDDALTSKPKFMKVFAGAENGVVSGIIHTILFDQEGRAWATGSNSKGQLCLGDKEHRMVPQMVPIEGNIVDIAIGSEHTLLLDEFGIVYACGSNVVGQIGLGSDVQITSDPIILEGLGTVESLSAGFDFSLFKSSDALYVTGSNFYDQLCVSDIVGAKVMEPYKIIDIDVEEVSTFEAIRTSSYILFSDGSVVGCGRNNFGQLGDGSNDDRIRTIVGPFPNDVRIRQLGVGPSSESAFFITYDRMICNWLK